ncbi:MAG TPA: MarR family transcriptional regulator [Streptosporangiaceae bacterium]|jgi:DNA-binding MarR family transcriptional regulator
MLSLRVDALPDADPDSSDDPLGAVLTLMRLSRALERVDSGLSPQQYRILKLAGAGGERSARLAERLAVARPTLTAIADSLVGAGLARREAEPGDRRVVRLHLTDAGDAAVGRADTAYADWLSQVLDLTGDSARIQSGLALVGAALDELRHLRGSIPHGPVSPGHALNPGAAAARPGRA